MSNLHSFGLIPILAGVAFIVFARWLAAAMIRRLERQLRAARKPSAIWLYRALGIVFIGFGITIVFSNVQSE